MTEIFATAEAVKMYGQHRIPLSLNRDGTVIANGENDPGAELSRKARQHAALHGCGLREAFGVVLADPDNSGLMEA